MDARVWLVVGVVAGVSASQVPRSAAGQEVDIPPVVVTRLQPPTPSLQTFEPVKRRAVPGSERLSVAVITQPTLQSLSEPARQPLNEPAVRIVKSPTLRSLAETQAQLETLPATTFRSLMQPTPQPVIRPAPQPDVESFAEPEVKPAEQRSIKAQFPTIRRRVIPAKAKSSAEPKPERSAQRSSRRVNRATPDQPSADPVPESNAPVVFTTAAIRF